MGRAGFEIPQGFKIVNPTPVDAWFGPYTGATRIEAINTALSEIPIEIRYKTMEIGVIDTVGGTDKYWFKNGITDNDLILMSDNEELLSLITGETQDRVSGDTALSNQLTGETQNRILEDVRLNNLITGETQDRINQGFLLFAQITGETQSREIEDSRLNDLITGETEDRILEDTALFNQLTGETENRISADQSLYDEITGETQSRTLEDIRLNNLITGLTETVNNNYTLLTGETQDRINQDFLLFAQITGLSETVSDNYNLITGLTQTVNDNYALLTGETEDRTTEDSRLNDLLTGLTETVNDNYNLLTGETQNRELEDTRLNDLITGETQDRIDGDINNYNLITGLTETVNINYNLLTGETEDRILEDIRLNNLITGETEDRTIEDARLNDLITGETYNRITGDTALYNQLTGETENRISADQSLYNEITGETQDRINADNSLFNQITGLTEIVNDNYNTFTGHTHNALYNSNDNSKVVYVDNGGNVHIDADIYQSGSTYETHAEDIYTTNDYIILRDGATTSLAEGQYAGFEAIKYDGLNNGRLVFDNTGTARVGDVGSEQPLATRDESTGMTDNGLTYWSASENKIKTAGNKDAFVPYTGGTNNVDLGIHNLTVDTNTLHVDSVNHRVGIGTTSPSQQLEIAVTPNTSGGILVRDNNTTERSILITSSNGNTAFPYIGTNGNRRLDFGANGARNFTIDVSGNIGIGTTSPSQQLEITKNFSLPVTTYNSGSTYGVIYKGNDRFIHDFNYGNNGTVTTGGYNLFIGINAGNFTMGSTATQVYHSSYNTGIGYQSLNSNTTGSYNSALGMYSLRNNTTGSYNSALGIYSLYSNTTGSYNSALGMYSLRNNTIGTNNSALGLQSLYSNTTGNQNSALGLQSLYSNTTGNQNSALGSASLYSNTTGTNNSALGYASLYFNTTGTNNSALGYASLYFNTTGIQNSALGSASLYSNTTGLNNSTLGYASLYTNVAGSNGVAFGYESQRYANNTATSFENKNTSVGFQSLRGSTTPSGNTGNGNTAIGYQSLFNNTTGNENTVLGYQSLYSNTTGSNNSALGRSAGDLLANGMGRDSGDNGVYIGYDTRSAANDTTNEIVIGANAIGQGSNTAVLGSTGITKTLLNGNVGIGTTAPSETLHIKTNETGAGASLLRLDNSGTASNEVGVDFWTSASDGTGPYATSRIYGKWDGAGYGTSRLTLQSSIGGTLTDTLILKNGNVGIGTTMPNSKLEVAGSLSLPYVSISTGYTVTEFDYTIHCTANSFTVTLPTAVGIAGRIYNIKNTGAGTITVDADGTETIDGLETQSVTTGVNLQLQSTGSGWIVI